MVISFKKSSVRSAHTITNICKNRLKELSPKLSRDWTLIWFWEKSPRFLIKNCPETGITRLIMRFREKSHVTNIKRSSRPEVFYERGVLKISQNSQESTCARVSTFNKVQASSLKPATILKTRLGTGVFLWILQNFKEYLFL